ncbi:MAG: hypothetical protein EOP45_16875 [Sphingobacteriaceae bacterium]|nr:MAG: hypothetical protein EOP45_16875 [Sphingobacteriaceae bacterium]
MPLKTKHTDNIEPSPTTYYKTQNDTGWQIVDQKPEDVSDDMIDTVRQDTQFERDFHDAELQEYQERNKFVLCACPTKTDLERNHTVHIHLRCISNPLTTNTIYQSVIPWSQGRHNHFEEYVSILAGCLSNRKRIDPQIL